MRTEVVPLWLNLERIIWNPALRESGNNIALFVIAFDHGFFTNLRLFFGPAFRLPGAGFSGLPRFPVLWVAGGGLGFSVDAVRVASELTPSAFKTRRPSLDVFLASVPLACAVKRELEQSALLSRRAFPTLRSFASSALVFLVDRFSPGALAGSWCGSLAQCGRLQIRQRGGPHSLIPAAPSSSPPGGRSLRAARARCRSALRTCAGCGPGRRSACC